MPAGAIVRADEGVTPAGRCAPDTPRETPLFGFALYVWYRLTSQRAPRFSIRFEGGDCRVRHTKQAWVSPSHTWAPLGVCYVAHYEKMKNAPIRPMHGDGVGNWGGRGECRSSSTCRDQGRVATPKMRSLRKA